MCWKYFFDVVAFESSVEEELGGPRSGPSGFRAGLLEGQCLRGEGDQVGQHPQPLGAQPPLERDRLGLDENAPVLDSSSSIMP